MESVDNNFYTVHRIASEKKANELTSNSENGEGEILEMEEEIVNAVISF